MFSLKFINRIKSLKRVISHNQTVLTSTRFKSKIAENPTSSADPTETESKSQSLGDFKSKYQVFRDEDSEIILDVFEEREKAQNLIEEEEEDDLFEGLNLERGATGVFDIEDLVEVLKRENSGNIFVAEVPKNIKYVDYICVVNGRSVKHMQAIAQFVRKVYKRKMKSKDLVPKLEGDGSKDWLALDLGNIALHIFSKEARMIYDLDSLWSVGPQFDKEYNKQDPVAEMLEKHSTFLQGFQPAS